MIIDAFACCRCAAMESLRRRRTELDASIAAVRRDAPSRQQIAELETRLQTHAEIEQQRIDYSEADESRARASLKELKEQKKLKNEKLRCMQKDVGALRKEIDKLEARLAEVHEQTRGIEQKIFGAFSESVGVSNVRGKALKIL